MCDNIANGQPRVLSVLGSTGGGGGECCPPANVIIASNVLSTTGNVIAGNIISQDGTFTGNLYVSGSILGNIIFTTANYQSANAAVLSFQTANGASLNVSSLEFTNQILPTNLPASGVTAGQYGNFSNVSSIQVDQYGRVTQASNVAILSSQWTNIDGNVAYQNGVSIGALTNPPPGSNLYVRGTANIDTLNVTSLYANSAIIFGGKTLNVWGISNLADLVAVTGNVLSLSSLASNTLVGNVSSFAAVSGNVLSLSSLASNTLVGNVATLWAANIYTTNISGFIGSQWVGDTGNPIYYLPEVSIGTTDASSNLTVSGNVYVSNALVTPNIYTSTIRNTAAINVYSNTSVSLQYNIPTLPALSGESAESMTTFDNTGVNIKSDDKTWNFNTAGSATFPFYTFPGYTGNPNQVLVDSVGSGSLSWSNLVQSKISNIYSLSVSSDSTVTFPGGITFSNNTWNYPSVLQTMNVGAVSWKFDPNGTTYFPGYRFPISDGTTGSVLRTDGYGVLNFSQIINLSKLYVDTVTDPTKTVVYNLDGSSIVLSPDQSLVGKAIVSIPSDISTSNLLIKNDGVGGVRIQSNNYQWNFGTDGNASFPGGIIIVSSNITTGNIVSLSSLTANIVTANVNSLATLGLSSLVANVATGNVSSLTAVTGNVTSLSSLAANVAVGNVSSLAVATGNVVSLSSLGANVAVGNVSSLAVATGNVTSLSSLAANVAVGNVSSLVVVTGNVTSLSSLEANVATGNVSSLAVVTGNVTSLSSLEANVATGNVSSLAVVTGNVISLSSMAANVAVGNVSSLSVVSGNVTSLSSMAANVTVGNVNSLSVVSGNVTSLSSLAANVGTGNVSSLTVVTGNVSSLSSLEANVAAGNVSSLDISLQRA
jgi:hypothetical protein